MTEKKEKRVFADVPSAVANDFLGKAKRNGTTGKALLEKFIRSYVSESAEGNVDRLAGRPMSLGYEQSRAVLGLAAMLSDEDCPDLYVTFSRYAVAVIEKYLEERSI